MRIVDVTEGEDFPLQRAEADRLRVAAERLRIQLHPSLPFLTERAGTFRLANVIGTVDLGGGLVIQVSPKVPVGSDWTTAVVSLLTGQEGIDLAGERRAGTSQLHNKLLDAVSGIYLSRLERAFRQEGPIMLMERRVADLPYLKGKWDITKWSKSALWRPHIFPVVRTELDSDNPFTGGLVLVATALASASSTQQTRSGLRVLARDLAAGSPRNAATTAGLASRSLPEQWSAYKPAWSLAIAILSRTSLLGPTGRHAGVGMAIEAWPLMETLLERTLQSIDRVGQRHGRKFTYRIQGQVRLLTPLGGKPQSTFASEPDGRLYENEKLVASFEAKYSHFDGTRPDRDHTYQTLSTAAACGAPLAILVYPNSFVSQVWKVSGFNESPSHLIAVGLDLFMWAPGRSAEVRGETIMKLIDEMKEPATTGLYGGIAV